MTEKYIVNNAFNMYVYIALKCGMTAYKSNEQKNMQHPAVVQVGLPMPTPPLTAAVKKPRQHECLIITFLTTARYVRVAV